MVLDTLPQTSETTTPASDDINSETSLLGEAVPDAVETTAEVVQETKEPAVEAAPALSPQEDYTDLQRRQDAGEPLTTDQNRRLGGYQQSIRDQQANAARVKQEQETSRARLQSLPDTTAASIMEKLTATVGLTDPTDPRVLLLQKEVKEVIAGYSNEAESVALAPRELKLRQDLTRVFGQRIASELDSAKNFDEVLGVALDESYRLGQRDAPSGKTLSDATTKLAKAEADLKKARDELDTFRGKGTGTAIGGTTATPADPSKFNDPAWVASAPLEEVLAARAARQGR